MNIEIQSISKKVLDGFSKNRGTIAKLMAIAHHYSTAKRFLS